MNKQRLNQKSTIVLIVIVCLIIALIVIIAIGTSKNKSAETTTSLTSTSSTTDVNSTLPPPEKYTSSVENHLYYEPGDDGLLLNGLYLVKMPGEKKASAHYFFDGKIDKSFSGLTPLANPPQARIADFDYWYYVKDGKVDTNFTGAVSYYHYMRVVKNGVYLNHYNGEVDLGGARAPCHNGAVHELELGREDGFIPPYKVTILD